MELEHRVIALEYKAETHDKELAFLRNTGDALKKTLEGVEKTLLQIKWLATGALGAFVANEFGAMKALKVVFGMG